MLKKFSAIAMLLLMAVSFTIGSVEPASVSPHKHSNIMTYWSGLPDGLPLPAFASGGVASYGGEPGYTSVILDLSGQGIPAEEGAGWQAHGFMPPFWGIHMMPANDHIEGRMIIQRPGSDAPSMFPVKFFRHQMPAMAGKAATVSYLADTTIAMGDDGGSYLTFNGEILVVNDSLQFNTNALPDEGYNNEITTGQTVWHQAQVSGESTAFNFDLKWNNPGDDLRLMVYTPDGHVLGPYADVSDGRTDGRINMEIDNPGGIADGAWLFKVTGTNVTGKDEYYIRTW